MSEFGLPHYMINTANLGLVVTDRVFYHQGLGPAVDVTISYNSLSAASSVFGRKWSFAFQTMLEESAGRVVLTSGSGQKIAFTAPAAKEYPAETAPPEGCPDSLTDYGEYWLYRKKGAGNRLRYDKVPGTAYSMPTAILDRNGNALTIDYNSDGTVRAIIDAAGREILFSYNQSGCCTSFALPDGRKAAFDFDGQGNMIKATDLAGIETLYEYDPEGYLIKMILGKQRRTTIFTYLDRGAYKTISAVTDARGHTTSYEIASLDPCIVRVTNPEGGVTFYQSSNGLAEKITDALGNYSATSYEKGLPVTYRDKRGNITAFRYDGRGNLLSVTDPNGNMHKCAYDERDNLISETNALGQVQTYAYDSKDNLLKITLPSGAESTYEYNGKGQLSSVKVKGNREVSFSYDRFGNMARATNAEGAATIFAYDHCGYRRVSITDAAGNTHAYAYDNNDREISYTYPDGGTMRYEYDCCAGIKTVDEIGTASCYIRDELSNVIRLLDAEEHTTHFFYNANNWLVKTVDPLARASSFFYNDLGLPVSVEDPLGNRALFSYDQEGNLLSYTDACGQQICFEYDAGNIPSKIINSLEGVSLLHKDALGRLQTLVNARGSKIAYLYDAEGRIVKKTYDQTEVAACRYDDIRNAEEISDAWGSREIVYNKNDQPVEIKYPGGSSAVYSYNTLAYPAAVTYGNWLAVKYRYDRRSRVTRVDFKDHYIEFTYDAAGNLVAETRSNGTETVYQCNSKHLITQITHQKDKNIFARVALERDPLNNVTAAELITPLESPREREAFHRQIGFNLAEKTMSLNGDRYSYDADGNLVGGEGWRAAYDPENRLVELASAGRKRSNLYDIFGHRVAVSEGGKRVHFHCDLQGRPLYETDEQGRVLCSYIYAAGQLVAAVLKEGRTLFYHYDAIGSTIALTGEDGDVAAAYAYEPYGKITACTGEAIGNRFTFVGAYGVMDEGDGLYFMKSRYYNSLAGRFIQADPIGIAGGGNLYAYAAGNPLRFIDPEGTNLISAGLIIKVLSAAGAVLGGATAYYYGKQAGAELDRRHAVSELEVQNLNRLGRDGDAVRYNRIAEIMARERQEALGNAFDAGKEAFKTGAETVLTAPAGHAGDAYTIIKEGYQRATSQSGARTPTPGRRPGSSAAGRGSAGRGPCTPPSSPSDLNKPLVLDWDSLTFND